MCSKIGFFWVMKNLESMKFIISLSRPKKSWNFSKGHGKSWKSNMLLENKQQKDEDLKEITDKSAKAFNFSRKRCKHSFQCFIMLENMLNK